LIFCAHSSGMEDGWRLWLGSSQVSDKELYSAFAISGSFEPAFPKRIHHHTNSYWVVGTPYLTGLHQGCPLSIRKTAAG